MDDLHNTGVLEAPSFPATMLPNSEESLAVDCATIGGYDGEATVKAAVITPPSCNFEENTPEARDAAAAEKWVHNSCVFRDNPSLMTGRMLISALKNQPPIHVVQFILSVNPKAASIPKKGPTPLQVAVENNASIEVVQLLLEACPFAVCVTNPDHVQDPLSYAKQHRRHDKDLIEILQRPLSYWINQRERDPNSSLYSFPLEDDNVRVAPPRSSSHCKEASHVDRQEIDNIKVLCAQVMKGHKKLCKQVSACQEKLEAAHFDKTQILKELHEEQKKHFYRQLIALDMKERAMQDKLDKMEQRCNSRCEERYEGWKQGMELWKATTDDQLTEWQVLLENEIKVNAHFRSDLARWMDEQSSESRDTPFVFATPLGELNERVPLFPKKSLGRVKKRQWNPLSRQWGRNKLQNNNE